jgi:hypothetical protein
MFKRKDKDERVSISAAELESAIGQAVRASPGCEDFIGVLVRPTRPKSPPAPNWEVLGLKFGNADRKAVNDAVATVVTRLEQEFQLQLKARS